MFGIWNYEPVQKKRKRVGSVFIIIGFLTVLLGYNWILDSIPLAHIPPKSPWLNMEARIDNGEITQENLNLLSQQTGLCQESIKSLLELGQGSRLLNLQEKYFAPVLVESIKTTPLTVSEWLVNERGEMVAGMPLVDLQDGDILITKNSRFLGWRNGHAGLVIDAKEGLILEAIMLGMDTEISSVRKWSTYPSFLVLRLKEEYRLSENFREKEEESLNIPQQVADYARENLKGIPYGLLAGVSERLSPKKSAGIQISAENATGPLLNRRSVSSGMEQGVVSEVTIKSTQCAHLVWHAYKQFGIDLDSDGGLLVTPFDIQNSEYLEVIQSYGY